MKKTNNEKIKASKKLPQVRKVSLPAPKAQTRINIEELRKNFKRQSSLPANDEMDKIKDPNDRAQESFEKIRGKTGVTFDKKMYEHRCSWDQDYPENPDRLKAVYERCVDQNLFAQCIDVPGRFATDKELEKCHSKRLIEILKLQELKGEADLKELSSKYDSVFFNNKTNECARWAAGSSVELTKKVMSGELQNGIALVRPPGHHAMQDDYCGYCFLNNIAIATKVALDECDAKKILIVDWDVHHGQATQQAFYDDGRVLYFSMHRYEHGHFWPNLRESDFDYIGEGAGKGFNFNIPLNNIGLKNEDYLMIFHQILLPVAYEFQPDLILISAGYDAALGCSEGLMELTPAVYAHMTSALMPLAGGKVVAFLEGGYFAESLAEGAAMTMRALLGDPCPLLVDQLGGPNRSLQETLRNVIHTQKEHWHCFKNRSYEPEDLIPIPIPHPSSEYPIKTVDSKFELMAQYPVTEESQIAEHLSQLDRLKQATTISTATRRVCLVYDEFMEKHFNAVDRGYPERPARTKEIMKMLHESKILERLYRIKPRQASFQELEMVHDNDWLTTLRTLPELSPRNRISLATQYDSIYFNEHSTKASLMAAGSLLQIVDSVCDGNSRSGVAVIRPPGHHAEINQPNGFCLVNNVAVAATYALKRHRLKRILIVDWDVHHGNGIQHVFEANPNVLYVSLHVYRNGDFFPYSCEADVHYVGTQKGRGFNVNIPWSQIGMGDGDYLSAFTRVVLPIAYEFNPELVLVSAGFDAAVNDPLGGCRVTPQCFGHMTHLLMSLASGKVILALEGGYNLVSISYSVSMCVKALLGDPLPSVDGHAPSLSATTTINSVIEMQKQFWSNLFSDTSHVSSLTTPVDATCLTPLKEKDPTEVNTLCDQLAGMSLPTTDEATAEPQGAEGGADIDDASKALIIQLMNGQEMYAIVPLEWCEHIRNGVNRVPRDGLDAKAPCYDCQDLVENWVCLTCYQVLCGRFVQEHMKKHSQQSRHQIVLSFADFSVWCYACDRYLDNPALDDAKLAAHASKFGLDTEPF